MSFSLPLYFWGGKKNDGKVKCLFCFFVFSAGGYREKYAGPPSVVDHLITLDYRALTITTAGWVSQISAVLLCESREKVCRVS